QINISTDQDIVRVAIRKERRVEFAVEGDVRYNDIRRWKIWDQVFDRPIMGMKRSESNNDFYQRTQYMERPTSKRFYFWPIYQNYLDNNPQLVQNKYW